MWTLFIWLVLLRFAIGQKESNFAVPSPSLIFSDCKHLILPARCQCYHSDYDSQLRCHTSELHSLPKLPNNMRWNALDFSANYITIVDSFVFADIFVEKIILKSNYIRRVEPTAFDQIKQLKELHLEYNQLKEFLPQTLVSPGKTLEIFDLSHNPFQHLDLGEILRHLPVLREFHAVSCHLKNESLYTLLKLQEDSLDEYNQTIPARGHEYLKLLDLSHNNLTSLCGQLFDGFHGLIELRLDHNRIHLIDNNFIRSLNHLQILNLAHNALYQVPALDSQSLESLNLSSNHFRRIGDYFASNLRAIRTIDFDHNSYLNSTSSRALCFVNLMSLKRLSFRYNNLLSLNTFSEFLCRLSENNISTIDILDIDHNMNLKCNCSLIQFQTYLSNYHNLTCTQQGQDRYYISKLTNWLSNCTFSFCTRRQTKTPLCDFSQSQRTITEGTCEKKARVQASISPIGRRKLPTTSKTSITKTSHRLPENVTVNGNDSYVVDNMTLFDFINQTRVKSRSTRRTSLIWMLLTLLWFLVIVD